MSTWNIYHKDGSKLTDVNGEQITVHGLEYSDSWMGECFLTISFKHEVPINFQIGDYIVYRGERFELNYEPGKDKQARPDTYGEGFVYDSVKFNALQDELSRAEFLDVVLTTNSTTPPYRNFHSTYRLWTICLTGFRRTSTSRLVRVFGRFTPGTWSVPCSVVPWKASGCQCTAKEQAITSSNRCLSQWIHRPVGRPLRL